jgi:excisionase family DNA binding protein
VTPAEREARQALEVERWLARPRSARAARKETITWRIGPAPELAPLEPATPAPAPSTWLTTAEAATYARVHRRTIYAWIRHGRVEWGQTPTGGRRVLAASLIVTP